MHGDDERISVQNVHDGLRDLFGIVVDFAGRPDAAPPMTDATLLTAPMGTGSTGVRRAVARRRPRCSSSSLAHHARVARRVGSGVTARPLSALASPPDPTCRTTVPVVGLLTESAGGSGPCSADASGSCPDLRSPPPTAAAHGGSLDGVLPGRGLRASGP